MVDLSDAILGVLVLFVLYVLAQSSFLTTPVTSQLAVGVVAAILIIGAITFLRKG